MTAPWVRLWAALMGFIRPEVKVQVEAHRARQERLRSQIPPDKRQKVTYDPDEIPEELGPRIWLTFVTRGPDGRFMTERVNWAGHELRSIQRSLATQPEWRDWFVLEALEAFNRLRKRQVAAIREYKRRRADEAKAARVERRTGLGGIRTYLGPDRRRGDHRPRLPR